MESRFFFSTNGDDVYGPLTPAAIRQLHRDQVLGPTSFLCREGENAWLPFTLEALPPTPSGRLPRPPQPRLGSAAEAAEVVPIEVLAPLPARPATLPQTNRAEPLPRAAKTVPLRSVATLVTPPSAAPEVAPPTSAASSPPDPQSARPEARAVSPVSQTAPPPSPRPTPAPTPPAPPPLEPFALEFLGIKPELTPAPSLTLPAQPPPPLPPPKSPKPASSPARRSFRELSPVSQTRLLLAGLGLLAVIDIVALVAYLQHENHLQHPSPPAAPVLQIGPTIGPGQSNVVILPTPPPSSAPTNAANPPAATAEETPTSAPPPAAADTSPGARISRDLQPVTQGLIAQAKACEDAAAPCRFDPETITSLDDLNARRAAIAKLRQTQSDELTYLQNFDDKCRAALAPEHLPDPTVSNAVVYLHESVHIGLLTSLLQLRVKLSGDHLARLDFLAKNWGKWTAKNGKLLFTDDRTSAIYDFFVQDIQDDATQIDDLRK